MLMPVFIFLGCYGYIYLRVSSLFETMSCVLSPSCGNVFSVCNYVCLFFFCGGGGLLMRLRFFFFICGRFGLDDNSAAMDENMQQLERFESDGRDSVEPVENDLKPQVANGECVAIRG